MVWKASGEERVKSYRVYRELEARYEEVSAENVRLLQQLAAKDELIRSLAAEVARLPTAGATEAIRQMSAVAYETTVPSPPKSGFTAPPPRTVSGQVPREDPGRYSIYRDDDPSHALTGDEELDSIPIPAPKRRHG